jgi:hypothetical protein
MGEYPGGESIGAGRGVWLTISVFLGLVPRIELSGA